MGPYSKFISKGIYSVPEAARLLGIPQQKIRGWVAGYPNTQGKPIIENEVGYINGDLALSFTNLMEARFIDMFAKYGVHGKSIRYMAEEAKRFLNHPHPFATDTIFKTDGRKIFAEVAERTGDKKLYDLKGKNWAFYDVIANSLMFDVVYFNGDAGEWFPKKHIAPNILIHPKIAFGKPSIKNRGIPTIALFDAFNVEGETYESVSRWYEIPVDEVKEAVLFELELSKAA